MSEPLARRHHFVTRAYLDLFADEHGKVLVYDKTLGREYPTNPINAAVVTNFNTVVIDGKESDVMEKALSEAEDKGVQALVAFSVGATLTGQQRSELAWFVALHFARTPTARRFNDELAQSLMDWTTEMVARFQENTGITIEAPAPDLSFTREDHIATMLDVANHGWPGLAGRTWGLVDIPDMLTADFPVVLVEADPVPGARGVGLGTAEEIHFAAGPSSLLVLSLPYGFSDQHVTDLDPAEALRVRQRMWMSAERFTYRRPGAPPPEGIDLQAKRVWGLLP